VFLSERILKMSCVDCGSSESYTQLPNGKEICRRCYGKRANDVLNPHFGQTGYGCCTPVDVQAEVQAAHDKAHRDAVKEAGIVCNCPRCRGEKSDFVFP
jgi:NMD protein affecting ribosome stability and mRNA decay